MRRRALLAAAVPGAVGLLAGCVSSGGSPRTTTVPDGGIDCPRYDEQIETVVCTPDLDESSGQMAMRPASSTGSLPEASFEFTLRNEREQVFNTNFYAWRLQKYVDGRWFHVEPREWPEPLMRMEPGDSHTWSVLVDNTDLARSIPHSQGTDEVSVVGLGGGTYSFGVEGWFEAEDHTSKTAYVTRLDLEGDPLTFGPTPDVEERVREGDDVIVQWPREEGDPVVYRVSRLKSVPDDAERVIPEQVVRDDALRNALSLFERWTRNVEVHTTETALSTGPPMDGKTIEYEGTGYQIEVDDEG